MVHRVVTFHPLVLKTHLVICHAKLVRVLLIGHVMQGQSGLEQIGNEGDQTHILDYFAILDDIGRLLWKMKNSLPYYSKT